MPTHVQIPDVGVVAFPDDMTDDEITHAIRFDILGEEQISAAPARSPVEDWPHEAVSWAREKLTPILGKSEDAAREARLNAGVPLEMSPEDLRVAAPTLAAAEEGEGPRLRRVVSTGMVEVPKLKGTDLMALGVPETPAKVAAGVERGLAGMVDFFTSPLGLATLGTAALPRLAQRVIAGAFAADMARHLPEQAAELGTALGEGDTERAAELVTSTGLTGWFVKKLGHEALGAGARRPGDVGGGKGVDSRGDGAGARREAPREGKEEGGGKVVDEASKVAEESVTSSGLDELLRTGDQRVAEEVRGINLENLNPRPEEGSAGIPAEALEGGEDLAREDLGRVGGGDVEESGRDRGPVESEAPVEGGQPVDPSVPVAAKSGFLAGSDLERWAEETIKGAGGRVSSGVDPALLSAYAVKGAVLIEKGTVKLGDWATEMIRAHGDEIVPHLDDLWKEAKALVARGGSGAAGSPALPPGTEAGGSAATGEMKERAFPLRVDAAPEVAPEVKEGLMARLYEARTNEGDAAAAGRMIDESIAATNGDVLRGLERAQRVALDKSGTLDEARRGALTFALVDRMGRQQERAKLLGDSALAEDLAQKQVELLDAQAVRSTGWAQGLQQMAAFGKMSPEAHVIKYRRAIDEAGANALENVQKDVETIKATVDEINKQVAGDVLDAGGIGAREASVESSAESPEAEAGLRREIGTIADGPVGEVATDHFNGGSQGKTLRDRLRAEAGLTEKQADAAAVGLEKEWKKRVASQEAGKAKRVRAAAAREAAKEEYIRKSRSVWDREKAAVGQKLVDALAGGGKSKPGEMRPALEEFGKRLAARFRETLTAMMPERARAVAKLTDIELLREAATNADKYEEAWRSAQEDVRHALRGDGKRLAELDKFFGMVAPELFSDGLLERLVRKQAAEMQVNLGQVVREHYGVADATGRSLAEKLVERAGLTGDAAARVAAAVQKKFSALATARKAAELKRMALPPKLRLGAKELHRKIIEASNLGALDNKAVYDVVRSRLGLPVYDKVVAAKVLEMGRALQKLPEGFRKQQKVAEMMNFIARQKGVGLLDLGMSFWYANLLSGPTTHFKNFVATAANVGLEMGIMVAMNPRLSMDILAGAGRGLMKGGNDAVAVLRSGIVTGTRLQKWEASKSLELMQFRGLAYSLNAFKYVARAMAAEDMVFFKAAEEARAVILSKDLAQREGLTGAALRQRTRDLLGNTQGRVAEAQSIAASEGLTGLEWRRRVAEIVEQGRSQSVRENAAEYARRVTFNGDPHGFMGAVAAGVNYTSRLAPVMRFVVPFTNIVANVVNEGLNYMPGVSQFRAGKAWWTNELYGRPIGSPRELHELIAKGIIGGTLLTGIAALVAAHGDEKDPLFSITGNGPRNAAQRKQLIETGWHPYSIKIGKRYMSFANAPTSLPLAVLGEYMDAKRYKHLDDADAESRTAYAMRSFLHVVTTQSFLSGLSDVFEMVQRDSTAKGGQSARNLVAKTTMSLVVPNALRQVDRIFDPGVYDSTTMAGAFAGQVPFVRRYGQPTLNVLGEPVKRDLLDQFGGKQSGDPVWTLLAEKQAWVPVPGRDQIVGDKKEGPYHFRVMTDEEYYNFVKESGVAIRRRLQAQLYDIKGMKPAEAKKRVQDIAEEERKNAKARFHL